MTEEGGALRAEITGMSLPNNQEMVSWKVVIMEQEEVQDRVTTASLTTEDDDR